jgi:hypothetical protein
MSFGEKYLKVGECEEGILSTQQIITTTKKHKRRDKMTSRK